MTGFHVARAMAGLAATFGASKYEKVQAFTFGAPGYLRFAQYQGWIEYDPIHPEVTPLGTKVRVTPPPVPDQMNAQTNRPVNNTPIKYSDPTIYNYGLTSDRIYAFGHRYAPIREELSNVLFQTRSRPGFDCGLELLGQMDAWTNRAEMYGQAFAKIKDNVLDCRPQPVEWLQRDCTDRWTFTDGNTFEEISEFTRPPTD